jgi:glycosyltransferase involved in cell wall biosynthesis
VLNLAEDLQRLGWQVDVLAPHAPSAALRETLHAVQVERFRYVWPESWQTVCYNGGAMVNLRKRPVEKFKLPALVGAQLIAVSWRLLARNYDIVHSHWILPQGLTGMIAGALAGVPQVITVHGGDVFSLNTPVMNLLKRTALHRAAAVTVNSTSTKAATLDIAPDIIDIRHIPMGVDDSHLGEEEKDLSQKVREQYRSAEGPLLVFVGRLVEEKGCEDALHAVSLLRRDMPGVRLLVLGEGQDRAELEELSRSLQLHHHVNFVGWVEPQKVRAYMAAADVFLGPSRTARDGWVEAQGLTFLEAMSAGTPVVASRLGGIVDSVQHEQTGLLVEEASPHQIANAVKRLSHDPQLTAQMQQRAQQLVTEQFSRRHSAEAFSDIFKQLRSAGKDREQR